MNTFLVGRRPEAMLSAVLKIALFSLSLIFIGSCTKNKAPSEKNEIKQPVAKATSALYQMHELPKGLVWESSNATPLYASSTAKKGGTFKTFLMSFPLTLRNVGPDSNGSFRSVINGNMMSLTEIHPNTKEIIPELASEWAYDEDGVTVYYKLNPKARWSDGNPVTADDYVFQLEFMRSKFITAPWYNTYYTEDIVSVKKHSKFIISVTGKVKKPKKELHYNYGISPRPRHFHVLDKNWVKNYNWTIEPNTGPYQISEIKKGKSITLKRKKDWWAKDFRLNKGRFNVDKIVYKVIRDLNVAWEYFKKSDIDSFSLIPPEYWYEKSKIDLFKKGYLHKVWFYVDRPQPDYGMWLNQSEEIFKDIRVRKAFAHAMNIKKVLKDVLRGDYFRLHTGATGYGPYTNNKIRAREFSIKKVAKLMRSVGWKRGKDGIWAKGKSRFSVAVTYGAPHHTKRLVVLKEEAKKAGVEISLNLLDASASFKTMREKKHQVAWSGWGSRPQPQYWGQYHSINANKPQTNNFSNTASKKIDQLIEAFKNELVEEKRFELSRDIQQAIYDDGAYIPTFLIPYFREGYWKWWKFPQPIATKDSGSLFGLFNPAGGLFWLDKDAKKQTKKDMKSGKIFKPVLIRDETYKID